MKFEAEGREFANFLRSLEYELQFLFPFFKHLKKVGLIEMNNFVAALVLQHFSGVFVYATVYILGQ